MTPFSMNYILFDDTRRRENLLPLTYMRPVAGIRIGILTIREKWERYLNTTASFLTEDYLSEKYPSVKAPNNMMINGTVLPDSRLVDRITQLKPNQALVKGDCILAIHLTDEEIDNVKDADYEEISYEDDTFCIQNTWDIFYHNKRAILEDFDLITKGKVSFGLSHTNLVLGGDQIFVEEGAEIEGVTLNSKTGPIYIGKGAEIMEGSSIRGPFALCDHGVVKMNSKIYGPTTIGPYSKVGGEVTQTVIFGYSNKAHDGFLGHSVIAEWCNLGADTNNSNLKNNYEDIRLWSYSQESFIDTGLQFCGMIMGDHSKTGINTMINTGTVIGVNANIYGYGFQRNFIPSFVWGGVTGFKNFEIKKAIEAAERMYQRRNLIFDETEKNILRNVCEISYKYRKG